MPMTPASARSRAFSVRSTVVLPEPDGPMITVTVPAGTSNEMSRRTVELAERLADAPHGRSSVPSCSHSLRATYLSSRLSSRFCANDRIRQMTQ